MIGREQFGKASVRAFQVVAGLVMALGLLILVFAGGLVAWCFLRVLWWAATVPF